MERILVVDDEAKIRKVYHSLLETEGYEVAEAPGAIEANEILKREHVDLILLDIKLPQLDGSILYYVMQLFHKGVKVIVTSVYPIDEQKNIIKEADGYYDKSQGTQILLNKIKKALHEESSKEDLQY